MEIPGFERVGGPGGVATWAAGSGPPVLLLHGYPQTHVMWHRVAPALAVDHTVVLVDLPGYGESSGSRFDKRSMAGAVGEVMTSLGHERYAVVGHDRGARVAHRLCLDAPERVTRAAVLDIVPTRHVFGTADRELGMAYYHWFFLAQPAPLPERLIAADPQWWVRYHLDAWSRVPDAFDPVALDAYAAAFDDPRVVAATCDDYRAGAGTDLEHDEASWAAGDRVRCPLLVMWGADGFVGAKYDVAAVWREYATDAAFASLACGHFLPEERPDETLAALRGFLRPDAP